MSKIKKSLPLAIRVDVIVCLLMAVLQDDLSFAILASLFILLTSLCIWEMSKEDPDNLVKALLGSNKYLIFDCFVSVFDDLSCCLWSSFNGSNLWYSLVILCYQ